ncbi:MAG: DUF5719 family protein [Aeromicrobium sp.]
MRPTREFLLPLVAAAVLAVVWVLPAHVDAERAPHAVKVTQSAYSCPIVGGTTVVAGRLAAHPGSKATATALPSGEAVKRLVSSNSWVDSPVEGDALLAMTTDAKGAGPVGFTGGVATKKDGGGLSVGSCPGVVQDAWYLGAGSGAKHLTTVTLTNLSDSPAVADISMWGDHGPVDAVNADGIVLESFQTRRITLESLAAGEPDLAVRVQSRRGALSAAVRDTSTAVFGGTEPISSTLSPTRHQVIPGIAGGAGSKQLLLLNPGRTTARVRVEALGKDGALVPTGLDDVKVGAGRTISLDLPKSAGNDPLALRLTSDYPLSGSVRTAESNKDYTYAVAGPVLDGPAIVPVSIKGVVKDATLVLTAPKKSATVTVTAYDSKMRKQGDTTLALKADTTGTIDLGKAKLFDVPSGDIAYVVVTSAGSVEGAAVYANGKGRSAMPLSPAPLKTLAPDVRSGH